MKLINGDPDDYTPEHSMFDILSEQLAKNGGREVARLEQSDSGEWSLTYLHENENPLGATSQPAQDIAAMQAHKGAELSDLHKLLETPERNEGEPTELEMHRADYEACKAAGFQSPGELLSAYKAQSKQLAEAQAWAIDCRDNILMRLAHEQTDLGRTADGLGQILASHGTSALQSAIAEAVEPWRSLAYRMQRHMLRTPETDALTIEFAELSAKKVE